MRRGARRARPIDRPAGGGVRGVGPGRGRVALRARAGRGPRGRGERPTPTRCVARRRWPPWVPSATPPPSTPCWALEDKPAVRRRATIALAAFDDPRVDGALRRCLEDRDWQVRQAAEDLLGRIWPLRRQRVPATRMPGRRRSGVGGDEELAQLVEGLEALPGAEGHALERGVDEVDGHGGLVGEAPGHAPQQRPAADEVDALEDDVLGQLGRRLAQAVAPRRR